MNRFFRIVIVQMTSTDNLDENFQWILNSCKAFVELKIQSDDKNRFRVGPDNSSMETLFCFPENALYLRIKEGEKIPPVTIDNEVFLKLAKFCKENSVHFHIGSVPLSGTGGKGIKGSPEKMLNSSVYIDSEGVVSPSYSKMHLFDIDLDSGMRVRESDVFHAGGEPQMIKIGGWNIGQTICYDLRFAELFSCYAKLSASLILVPAAFLVPTGKAHWEPLLRARAIESQCFVAAAAQAGTHLNSRGDSRMTYGHSMLVSPWGEVLVHASPDKPEFCEIILDHDLITSVRKQIPMASHRRFW